MGDAWPPAEDGGAAGRSGCRARRLVGHPLVATGIFIGSIYLLYLTPLLQAAMRNHWATC
jgi:cytochrome c oxidase assembly factor CtaG